MESWRKTLYIISAAEFAVLVGFGFTTPFLPLFIQKMGSYTSEQAAFWAGMASGGSGLAMFFSSPLWGMAADRWGRKPMVLRAQFGLAAVLVLIAFSPNVYYLTGLRFFQGLLGGTVPAASALVAAQTPRDKIPFAMGLFMLSVFGGTTIGPLLGGVFADQFGFTTAFFVAAGLLFASGLLVLFLVKETFERPAEGQRIRVRGMMGMAFSKEMLPLLTVVCALNIAPQMIAPIVPLIIRGVSSGGSAAGASGLAFALLGVTAALSSFSVGRLVGRFSLKKIIVFCCIGTALLYLPPIWAGTVAALVILIGITGLFTGAMITSASSMIGLAVSSSQQGVAYGLYQSAAALGMGLGPLLGGILAAPIGLRPVFGVAGGMLALTGLLVMKILPEKPRNT